MVGPKWEPERCAPEDEPVQQLVVVPSPDDRISEHAGACGAAFDRQFDRLADQHLGHHQGLAVPHGRPERLMATQTQQPA
jgi:hypothetical protein